MNLNKFIAITGLASIIFLITYLIKRHFKNTKNNERTITIMQSNIFDIPSNTKRLGIIGSTPHPTVFLNKRGYPYLPKNLSEFIEVESLRDSFEKTIVLGKQQGIDHLLIAYLPIYYSKIKKQLKDKTPLYINQFLKIIIPEIKEILENCLVKHSIPFQVTLILPTIERLQEIPEKLNSEEQYIQYLIKQFPYLNRLDNELETIVIMNTSSGHNEQDARIVRYFEYEYLLDTPVQYMLATIDKPKFHTYI